MGFGSSLGRLEDGDVSCITEMCDRSRLSDVPQTAGTATGSYPLMGFTGDGSKEMRSQEPEEHASNRSDTGCIEQHGTGDRGDILAVAGPSAFYATCA